MRKACKSASIATQTVDYAISGWRMPFLNFFFIDVYCIVSIRKKDCKRPRTVSIHGSYFYYSAMLPTRTGPCGCVGIFACIHAVPCGSSRMCLTPEAAAGGRRWRSYPRMVGFTPAVIPVTGQQRRRIFLTEAATQDRNSGAGTAVSVTACRSRACAAVGWRACGPARAPAGMYGHGLTWPRLQVGRPSRPGAATDPFAGWHVAVAKLVGHGLARA